MIINFKPKPERALGDQDEIDEIFKHAPDQLWSCSCGCNLFFVSPVNIICMECGIEQSF